MLALVAPGACRREIRPVVRPASGDGHDVVDVLCRCSAVGTRVIGENRDVRIALRRAACLPQPLRQPRLSAEMLAVPVPPQLATLACLGLMLSRIFTSTPAACLQITASPCSLGFAMTDGAAMPGGPLVLRVGMTLWAGVAALGPDAFGPLSGAFLFAMTDATVRSPRTLTLRVRVPLLTRSLSHVGHRLTRWSTGPRVLQHSGAT